MRLLSKIRKMDKYFIYGLYNAMGLFYVGITSDLAQRLRSHKVKYGQHITLQVLDTYSGSEDAALSLESFWIKKMRDLGFVLDNKKCAIFPRRHRAYRCSNEVYEKAVNKAKTEGIKVANLIEEFLRIYNDYDKLIIVVTDENGKSTEIDLVQYIQNVNAEP